MSENFVDDGNDKTNFVDQSSNTTPESQDKSDQDNLEINGRKYSLADVANKINHQDEHIKRLEAEGKEQREALARALEKLETSSKVEDLMNQQRQPDEPNKPAAEEQAAPASPQLSEDELFERFEKRQRERTNQEKAADNLRHAQESLTAVYGDNTNAKVSEIAAKHGFTIQGIKDLASTSPSAFRALFPEMAKANQRLPDSSGKTNTAFHKQEKSSDDFSEFAKQFWNSKSEKERTRLIHSRIANL